MELVTNNNTSTTFLVIRQGSMNDKCCAETKLLNILGQAGELCLFSIGRHV